MAWSPTNRRETSWRVLLLLTAALGSAACGDTPVALVPEVDAAKGGASGGGSAPQVSSVVPSDSPRNLTLDVTVTGSGFDRGSIVTFELGGLPAPKVRTNSTRYVSSQQLVANITVEADATPMLYDVAVTTSGGKRGIGVERFEVLALIVLEPPAGETLMSVTAINSSAHVVGISYTAPFFWTLGEGATSMQPGFWGVVDDLNDRDQAVGANCGVPFSQCTSLSMTYGALWERAAGGWTVRQVTGYAGRAMAITSEGTIYGNDPGPAQWLPSGSGGFSRTDLPIPTPSPGAPEPRVVAANNTGQVVGGRWIWSYDQGIWRLTDIPAPPGGADPAAVDVADINTDGRLVVVGSATTRGYQQAFRWTFAREQGSSWVPVTIENLGAAAGAKLSAAFGVNVLGEAVGRVLKKTFYVPVRWPVAGAPVILPYPKNGSGEAHSVSDNGWIAGQVGFPSQGGTTSRAAVWRAP